MKDEELIIKYRGGDRKALDELCDRYKTVVKGLCASLFLVGAEKDDLIQEGMLGLFKAVLDYDLDSEAAFSTFANLCIRRQLYKAIDASHTLKNMFLNDYDSLDDSLDQPGENDPAVAIEERDYIEYLKHKILSKLSKMEKEVFGLYLAGMDISQIARVLGKPDKSVANTITRIKEKATKLREE